METLLILIGLAIFAFAAKLALEGVA